MFSIKTGAKKKASERGRESETSLVEEIPKNLILVATSGITPETLKPKLVLWNQYGKMVQGNQKILVSSVFCLLIFSTTNTIN